MLLQRQFEGRKEQGNRLKTERVVPLRFRRYQEGAVIKVGKVWYGVFREDVPQLTGGPCLRKQRKVRLGPVKELPKAQARELLRVRMNARPSADTKVRELVTRWEEVKKP